ncbi:MAG: right-handed parallel beta-helix repeat-containing protein [Bacteroidales bacterium]|nr:right-handed parallel beta-helix repeat-containing protein [Bacteroidales bacterium]
MGFPFRSVVQFLLTAATIFVIENCTIKDINSLAIDLGNEMWFTTIQPYLGYHTVRGNTIKNCGISGLQAMRAINILVEDNLFEQIGWQNAEHAFESGGLKFHQAVNCLIRRNVFRNIRYAPGIWLDYLSTENCRITKNVFTGITTARGCVYIEVSRRYCQVDHNVFHDTHSQYWLSGDYGAGGSALYTDGSDSIRFENNLMLNIENTGYGSYLNAPRIVDGRGGVTRWHTIEKNIFIDCRKQMIELPNEHNYTDFNVFSGFSPGYLKMALPEPALLLDLEAWRKLYGWGKNSRSDIEMAGSLNTDSLTLTLIIEQGKAKYLEGLGPFTNYTNTVNINLDPRKQK